MKEAVDYYGRKPDAKRDHKEQLKPPGAAGKKGGALSQLRFNDAGLDTLAFGFVVDLVVDGIKDPVECAAGQPSEQCAAGLCKKSEHSTVLSAQSDKSKAK